MAVIDCMSSPVMQVRNGHVKLAYDRIGGLIYDQLALASSTH